MHRGLVAEPFELRVGNCVLKALRVSQIDAHVVFSFANGFIADIAGSMVATSRGR
jgi:hypothetical protein